MRAFFLHPGRHDPATSLGLLLLRGVPAFWLIWHHGLTKMTAFGVGISDPFGLGQTGSAIALVVVESVAPTLVLVGLFTRGAALIAAIGLGLLALHAPGWDASFFALPGRQTALAAATPILYTATFTGVVFTGAGALSLDRLLGGAR